MDRNIMIMLIAGIVAGVVVGAGAAVLLTDDGNTPPGDEFDHMNKYFSPNNNPETIMALLDDYFADWTASEGEWDDGYIRTFSKDGKDLRITISVSASPNDAVWKYAEMLGPMGGLWDTTLENYSKCELGFLYTSTVTINNDGDKAPYYVLGFQDLNLFALFEGAVDLEIIDGALKILQNFVHEKAELRPHLV